MAVDTLGEETGREEKWHADLATEDGENEEAYCGRVEHRS